MPNPSETKHTIWKHGEYRDEYLANENVGDFHQGLLRAVDVDILPQGPLHRRGGFQLVEGGLTKGMELAASGTQYTISGIEDGFPSTYARTGRESFTFKVFLEDYKVAEFKEGLWGLVVLVRLVYSRAVGIVFGSDVPPLRMILPALYRGRSLEERVREMGGELVNFLSSRKPTITGSIYDDAGGLNLGRKWNFVGQFDVIPDFGVFLVNSSLWNAFPGDISKFRMEQIGSNLYAFSPPAFPKQSMPLYLGRDEGGEGFGLVAPWGAGVGSASTLKRGTDTQTLAEKRKFVEDFPYTSTAELGVGESEFIREGVVFVDEILPGVKGGNNIFSFDTRTAAGENLVVSVGSGIPARKDYFKYRRLASATTLVDDERVSTLERVPGGVQREFPYVFESDNAMISQAGDLRFLDSQLLQGRLVEAATVGTSTIKNVRDLWWVRARVAKNILKRLVWFEGYGGYLVARFTKQGTSENRELLVRVVRGGGLNTLKHPGLGARKDDDVLSSDLTPNVFLGFKVADVNENDRGKSMKFDSLGQVFDFLRGQSQLSFFRFLHFNQENGSPRNITRVSSRTILSGFNLNYLVASYAGIPSVLTGFVPFQFRLTEKELELLKEPGGADNLGGPGSNATFDQAVYYALLTSGNTEEERALAYPFSTEVTLPGDSKPLWVSGQEGAVMGTETGELDIGDLQAGRTRFNRYVSDRGSSSSLTAKGDSSIFFVGPDGRDLYQMFFRQGRSGMLTRSITYHGGSFIQEGVKDMKWDFQRKALWVIYGEGKVALYFSDEQYEIGGWVRYSFGGDLDFRARALVRFADRTVGFIREDLSLYRCPIPYRFDYTRFRDDLRDGNTTDYAAKLRLICHATRSSTGSASNFTQRVRRILLKTRGVGQLFSGVAQVAKGGPPERGNVQWNLAPYVEESGADLGITYVDVEHRGNEKALFLSMGFTAEVNDR